MEKYTIKNSAWKKTHKIIAEPQVADELFTALCDYYGIDSGNIVKKYQGYGDMFLQAWAASDDGCKLEIKRAKNENQSL